MARKKNKHGNSYPSFQRRYRRVLVSGTHTQHTPEGVRRYKAGDELDVSERELNSFPGRFASVPETPSSDDPAATDKDVGEESSDGDDD